MQHSKTVSESRRICAELDTGSKVDREGDQCSTEDGEEGLLLHRMYDSMLTGKGELLFPGNF